MRPLVLALFMLFSSFVLSAQTSPPSPNSSDELPKLMHLTADQVNPQVDPCTDFYQYTCSKFFAANPIPADRVAWGVVSTLSKWNEVTMRQILEASAAKKEGRTAAEQKIGDYYTSCMDESRVETNSPVALKAELERIDKITAKLQLAEAVAHLHMIIPGAWDANDAATFAPMFGFSSSPDFDDVTKVIAEFDQGGFVLPGRDFYLKDDAKSVEIRKVYEAHVAKMLELAGEGENQAAAGAATVLTMETALAKAAMDEVKRRDPKNINNKMSLEELQKIAPAFNWKQYITVLKAPASPTYLVTSPDFFRGLNQLIEQQSLAHWKAYLRWQLVHGAAPYMNHAMVNEDFNLARALTGAKALPPRTRRCVNSTDRALGEALGEAYVARAFPPESKERVLKMVHAIEAALEQDVNGLDWMTPETKVQAKAKLHMILDKIGYPDHFRDYSALEITRDSYFGNVEKSTVFEFARQLNKIGKPLDRLEWQMTPPTINAYYDAQTNTINFPAGILQPPLFDRDQDEAANYGAEGAVIGHEISHGFDDQGRKFDGNGNLRDWWTESDAKNYDERGKCISDEYTQEIPEAGVKQNGLLTQGEDTADNGGIHLALMALRNTLKEQGKSLDDKGSDGITELRRFFLAYANDWCTQFRPEIMRTQVLTNPHSLPKYRVNNVVANMPEFAQAFGCKKGQPMVREKTCRVW
ncbi:MAG TPA: M13 family metallopeptidase [Terriglobales bacterium]